MQNMKSTKRLGAVFALCAIAGVASGEEIQGQKGMSGGATAITKGVNVTQAQLTGAGIVGNIHALTQSPVIGVLHERPVRRCMQGKQPATQAN